MKTCGLCEKQHHDANMRAFYHWKFEWVDICYGCIAELITKALDKKA